jgi:two-component system nitrogen regulation sensor histidine kinase NtrY
MANDIDRQAAFLIGSPQALEHIVQTQSIIRSLSEAVVFDSSKRILARSQLAFSLEFEEVPPSALTEAQGGEVVIMTSENDDRVRALVKLNNFLDTYLYVGRAVDPKVLSHLDATRKASEDYEDLQLRYADFQVAAILIFVVVGFILLLMAVGFGLYLARQLVEPISLLITAADRVRSGDMTARVPEQKTLEEFDFLAKAFNRMTRQIEEQQNELISANRQLDRRRQLTETVLTGVSSGVIGVDEKGVIHLANQSALALLGQDENASLVGRKMADVFPGIEDLLSAAHKRPGKTTQAELPFLQGKDKRRTFLVRIVIELIGADDVGAILTFDDITELQSAQRKAAWADVARRIAHEIKNPLTPIQLSAERLRRKYLDQIKTDPEIFAQCTDTIIKHVGDIGRMVNEFSSFARMPEPILKTGDLTRQVEEVIFLHKQAHSQISFEFEHDKNVSYIAHFDAQQMRQALNNLIQNAVDSIDMRLQKDSSGASGVVSVLVGFYGPEEIFIAVTDNGIGLPENENPIRLTEPYVTHKPKGTGLGLAIVKKIMEDHKGDIFLGAPQWLKDVPGWEAFETGATIVLTVPCEASADFQHNQASKDANLV